VPISSTYLFSLHAFNLHVQLPTTFPSHPTPASARAPVPVPASIPPTTDAATSPDMSGLDDECTTGAARKKMQAIYGKMMREKTRRPLSTSFHIYFTSLHKEKKNSSMPRQKTPPNHHSPSQYNQILNPNPLTLKPPAPPDPDPVRPLQPPDPILPSTYHNHRNRIRPNNPRRCLL
jgi:hypothetical protein